MAMSGSDRYQSVGSDRLSKPVIQLLLGISVAVKAYCLTGVRTRLHLSYDPGSDSVLLQISKTVFASSRRNRDNKADPHVECSEHVIVIEFALLDESDRKSAVSPTSLSRIITVHEFGTTLGMFPMKSATRDMSHRGDRSGF